MDPLLDHVATLKYSERDKGGNDASLPTPVPPSGSNLDHQVAAESDNGSMADNDRQPIPPHTAAPLPNHAVPTQEVFQFSAMDMDIQSKATHGGHHRQLNGRAHRTAYTSPGKGMGTVEQLKASPSPHHPIVNSSLREVFEFKSSNTQGTSLCTPLRVRRGRVHSTPDSHHDSPSQERDATAAATTSPAVDLGGSSSTFQREPEQPLSSEKDVTMSSVMEMDDTAEESVPTPPAAAAVAEAHSSCSVNVNRESSRNTFVFGISPSKQPPSSSTTTTPSISLPFTFSLSSSPSSLAAEPQTNDGSNNASHSGILPFNAIPDDQLFQSTYFGAAATTTTVSDTTATLPVIQPPENGAVCNIFSSWEDEVEAVRQMQLNPFSPSTCPGGSSVSDKGGRYTKMKRGGTEAGTVRAHSNSVHLRRRSRHQQQQQQRVSAPILSNTATTEASPPQISLNATTMTSPHVEGDLDLNLDLYADKLLQAWEEQVLRGEARKKIAEDRMLVLHIEEVIFHI